MIENEDYSNLKTCYGYFDIGLGFIASLLYFLYLHGGLGTQWLLDLVVKLSQLSRLLALGDMSFSAYL